MIAIYGLKFIAISLILTVILTLWAISRDSLGVLIAAALLSLVTLMLLFFYRNPSRDIPQDNDLVLSLADGRVLSVEEINNDFIGGRGHKVSVFLSIFDVHINRIPVGGKVEYINYKPGVFLKAFEERASMENEQTEIGLSFDKGRIIFKQIAGMLARRIECRLAEGDSVKAGNIFGMIHFGSRAEIFLPENIEILIKAGDKVKAGTSAVGRIKE